MMLLYNGKIGKIMLVYACSSFLFDSRCCHCMECHILYTVFPLIEAGFQIQAGGQTSFVLIEAGSLIHAGSLTEAGRV